MITELSAQNFKSWQDTSSLQFAPLTGFFGANNSGKTSILQLLLLLKQTVEQPPEWNEPLYFGDGGSPVNLVDFDAVIHGHKQDLSLGISVSWKLPEVKQIHLDSTDYLSFSTSVRKKIESVELSDFSYAFGDNRFTIGWTDQGHQLIPSNRSASYMPADIFRCYGILNSTNVLEPFLPLKNAFEDLFFIVHHLGPLRRDPRHSYHWSSRHPKDVGQHGEDMIDSLLSGRVRRLSIEEQILNWLQQLELINSYDLHPTSNSQEYEFLRQTARKRDRSRAHRRGVRHFPSPAGASPLLLC